jgi:hypothetical protein
MTKLTVLSADDKLAEIRRLYFATTRRTIADDFARAVQLLKSMSTEEERERAAVYMDGLSQMRSDWGRGGQRKQPTAIAPKGNKPPGNGKKRLR